MSLPDRLWRLARGYWVQTGDRLEDARARLAQADAYQELADALRVAPMPRDAQPEPPAPTTRPATPPQSQSPSPAAALDTGDPMAVCYHLLRVEPGVTLPALDLAYAARLAELNVDHHAPGTPERAAAEGKRAALSAAYERLRDCLNPVESRMEHLEF